MTFLHWPRRGWTSSKPLSKDEWLARRWQAERSARERTARQQRSTQRFKVAAAALAHEIAVLGQRIRRGEDMIADLDPGDARQLKWRNHLNGLRQERSRLQRLR